MAEIATLLPRSVKHPDRELAWAGQHWTLQTAELAIRNIARAIYKEAFDEAICRKAGPTDRFGKNNRLLLHPSHAATSTGCFTVVTDGRSLPHRPSCNISLKEIGAAGRCRLARRTSEQARDQEFLCQCCGISDLLSMTPYLALARSAPSLRAGEADVSIDRLSSIVGPDPEFANQQFR